MEIDSGMEAYLALGIDVANVGSDTYIKFIRRCS